MTTPAVQSAHQFSSFALTSKPAIAACVVTGIALAVLGGLVLGGVMPTRMGSTLAMAATGATFVGTCVSQVVKQRLPKETIAACVVTGIALAALGGLVLGGVIPVGLGGTVAMTVIGATLVAFAGACACRVEEHRDERGKGELTRTYTAQGLRSRPAVPKSLSELVTEASNHAGTAARAAEAVKSPSGAVPKEKAVYSEVLKLLFPNEDHGECATRCAEVALAAASKADQVPRKADRSPLIDEQLFRGIIESLQDMANQLSWLAETLAYYTGDSCQQRADSYLGKALKDAATADARFMSFAIVNFKRAASLVGTNNDTVRQLAAQIAIADPDAFAYAAQAALAKADLAYFEELATRISKIEIAIPSDGEDE